MKKTAQIILISSLLLTLVTKPAKAQTFTAQKAFEDYQYQQTQYLQSEADYEDAKTFYKKNPTLQLREAARQKTLVLLKNRDQLMITYLTALRMQIVESTGFGDNEKGAIFGKIDPEVLWYQSHMSNYQDGDDLATLFGKSDESKARYQTQTRFIAYESLFDISLSQEIGLRIDHQAIYAGLTSYINDQVSQGKLKIDPFNRWLNDTDNVLLTLSQNEALSRKKLSTLYSQNYAVSQTYTAGVQVLIASITPLSQLNNYLSEMLNTIRSQIQ